MTSRNLSNQVAKLLILGAMIMFILAGTLLLRGPALADTAPQIRLQYATFDPLQGEPELLGAIPLAAAEAGQPATYLLQFSGPVQSEWKATAAQAGAMLYDYVPDFAFIARMDGATAEQVAGLPFVRWVGLYQPAYRLAPGLLAALTEPTSDAPLVLEVQTLPDVDQVALAARLGALVGELKSQAFNGYAGYLRLTLPAEQLGALAALDGVLWVEPYYEPELLNDKAGTEIMHGGAVRTALGVSGQGQIVGVADSGLDTGNLTTLHPDVRGRVISAYCLGQPAPCFWGDYNSHGTHVVGSVLGNGQVSGGTYTGLAPQAQLVFQGIMDALGGLGGIPTDRGDLMRTAYADGARVHSNSWGGPSGGTSPNYTYGGYVSSSRQVDQAMWEMKDLLVLFAAGNSGADANKDGLIDPDSINQPGTAKNVLSVGASENYRPTIPFTWGSSYGAPINTDPRTDNAGGMAAFSSRGPTDDGRIKPDVVAPGTYIASMRTQQYLVNDNLEGDVSGYQVMTLGGGTGSAPWALRTDDPHSPTHYFKETVSGSYTAGAASVLFGPPVDLRPSGGYFQVHFWHKYNLSAGDQMVVFVLDPATTNYVYTLLAESGAVSSYQLRSASFSLGSFYSTPTSVRIGFGIVSDGSSDSTWQIDDIRVDGSDWGSLSGLGLANPGDAVDEAYVMMGGTSMATPLTAGATALVRDWLTDIRKVAAPSGALMKAVLINGATDMSPGQYLSPQEVPDVRPNNVTGWGRVDLLASLNPPIPRQIWLQDYTTGLGTGNKQTYMLTVGITSTTGLATAEAAVPAIAPPDKRVELRIDQNDHTSLAQPSTPNLPLADVSMTLDDGSAENWFDVIDTGGNSYQFIWLNRFTPAASEFPFTLDEIWVLFEDTEGTLSAGQAIQLAVYQDADGDPSNGATLLGTVNETIKAVDGSTWSQYTLASPISVSGPGDVLVGVINRYTVDGVSPASYPAARDDSSTNHERSWIGWWYDIPPDPPQLPTDMYFAPMLGVEGGNWMIRAFGTTGTEPEPTATATATATLPSPTVEPGEGGPLRVTLAWTDYPGSLLAAKALVNDLDLEVIAPDGTTHYYGNAGAYLSGNACLRDNKWDSCNNVEGVLIPNALPGTYTINVYGYNVPSGPQPFALVASGDNLLGGYQNMTNLYIPMIRR